MIFKKKLKNKIKCEIGPEFEVRLFQFLKNQFLIFFSVLFCWICVDELKKKVKFPIKIGDVCVRIFMNEIVFLNFKSHTNVTS